MTNGTGRPHQGRPVPSEVLRADYTQRACPPSRGIVAPVR